MTVAVPRAAVSSESWNRFIDSHSSGWWFHRSEWIEYALVYAGVGAVDESMALIGSNGEVVGAAPNVRLFGGQELPLPITSENYAWQIGKGPYVLRPGSSVLPLTDEWSKKGTFVIDLQQGAATLWRNTRKSYRSLIHQAERNVRIEEEKRIADAFLIHRQEAGRITRPIETWMMQEAWIASGNALLLMAYRGNLPLAFAYTIIYKDWAYYGSGASSEKDLSHALIWKTMIRLRQLGVNWFEIGHAADEGDNDKARSIAFFKSGFGGALWPVWSWRLRA